MNHISLTFDRKLTNLHYAMDITERLANDLVKAEIVSQEWSDDLQVVMSEACTNAIKHSGDLPENTTVVVEFNINDDCLCVVVREKGTGFSLDSVNEPDLDNPLGHGLGLFLMKEKSDELSYRHDGQWNVLQIVKRFSPTKIAAR